MSNDNEGFPTTTVPVQKWVLNLESIEDEAAAIAGWHALVKAQGWSPVGEPNVRRIPASNNVDETVSLVIGRIVKTPGITVSAAITNAIVVPA